MSNDIRDVKGDYHRAYLDAYDGLIRANRADEADQVAEVLAEHYGRIIPKEKPQTAAEKKAAAEKAKATAAAGSKENANATPAPENTAAAGSKE
ncbi:hypothetical protein ACTWPB_07590 [Nocardia sp. IBHARD005]|uniref:hypothetical protein n=1 Tax=Nocardia sp. IBHARD005 TaxID=3457765 RepID=UPI004058E150